MKTLIMVIPASRDMHIFDVYFAREEELQGVPLDLSYLAPSSWIRKFLRICFQHYIQKFQH